MYITIIRPYVSQQREGQLPALLLPIVHAYMKSFFLSLGGTVLTIVLPTQMHFSKVIS